jgi:hypothetical protein
MKVEEPLRVGKDEGEMNQGRAIDDTFERPLRPLAWPTLAVLFSEVPLVGRAFQGGCVNEYVAIQSAVAPEGIVKDVEPREVITQDHATFRGK